jgi:hypothetical protein
VSGISALLKPLGLCQVIQWESLGDVFLGVTGFRQVSYTGDQLAIILPGFADIDTAPQEFLGKYLNLFGKISLMMNNLGFLHNRKHMLNFFDFIGFMDS